MGTVTLRISMIILLIPVLTCGFVCIKRWADAKLQMSICLFVLIVCTMGVGFIPDEEVKLVELCVGLLSSTIFAILYTSISDKNIVKQLKGIENKIEDHNNLDYFKADNIYKENDLHKPNMQLCDELSKMLSESTTYI